MEMNLREDVQIQKRKNVGSFSILRTPRERRQSCKDGRWMGQRNVPNTVNGRVELLFSSLNLRHCYSGVLMLIIAGDIVHKSLGSVQFRRMTFQTNFNRASHCYLI